MIHLSSMLRRYLPFGTLLGLLGTILPVSAQAPADDELVKLDAFTVNSEADVGYGTRYSTGASRINMENTSISAAVITLNEQFIDDLKPIEMFDVLKYVS